MLITYLGALPLLLVFKIASGSRYLHLGLYLCYRCLHVDASKDSCTRRCHLNIINRSIAFGPVRRSKLAVLTRLFHVDENYSSLWSCLLSIHPSWTAIVPKHPSFIRFNPVMYKPDFPAVILISTQLVHPRY